MLIWCPSQTENIQLPSIKKHQVGQSVCCGGPSLLKSLFASKCCCPRQLAMLPPPRNPTEYKCMGHNIWGKHFNTVSQEMSQTTYPYQVFAPYAVQQCWEDLQAIVTSRETVNSSANSNNQNKWCILIMSISHWFAPYRKMTLLYAVHCNRFTLFKSESKSDFF